MSERMDRLSAIIKHVWSEPRFVAWVQWHEQHPGLSRQLEDQMGYDAMRYYAETGQHLPGVAEQTVEFIRYDEPDWDWWEPTSERRRKDAYRRACP